MNPFPRKKKKNMATYATYYTYLIKRLESLILIINKKYTKKVNVIKYTLLVCVLTCVFNAVIELIIYQVACKNAL